ncbi:MAG: monofunctional biosynthetic peptidoglycan transglycosylase [Nitrosomonas sp.]
MIKSLLRWVGWLLLLLFSLLLLLQAWFLLHILYWNQYNPSSSAFMQIRWEIARQNQPHVKFHYQWVDYEKISPHLKRAIIAAEDSQFLNHAGFDFKAMQNALEKNWQEGRWVVGGSTISQQLAKNLFLSDQKTPWRKLQEAVITYMLEKVMAKRRILEIYLNMIEWGENVFGAEAASQHYFGVKALALTPRQAAFLASMVPNPRFYDRNRTAKKLLKKTDIILKRMPSSQIP